jgi:hypothetical protein
MEVQIVASSDNHDDVLRMMQSLHALVARGSLQLEGDKACDCLGVASS